MKKLKSEIRKKAIKNRSSLSNADVRSMSKKISRLLFEQTVFKQAKTVLFYASFNNEVLTDEMIGQAVKEGKIVGLPVVDEEKKMLKVKQVNCLDNLNKECLGIRQPSNDFPDISPSKIDVVIVPGCCFDKKGFRVGYGGGYYDRFLSGLKVIKIGLAFESQIVDSLPVELHDQQLNGLITEKKLYNFSMPIF
jgi:5-formyltetrahydrofolate cyclo-ligase